VRQEDDEEAQVRSVALRNAASILMARQRAEEELLRAKEALRESQERLQAALAAAGTGTFRWDLRTDAVEWDENLGHLFGLSPGRAPRVHEQFLAAVHPADRARVAASCERSARDGDELDLEFRVPCPDGSVRWLAEKARTFVADDGRPLYVTGACVDVTRRKQVEEALREETRLLELLNDSGTAIAGQLDVRSLAHTLTAAATQLSGAAFGVFYYNAGLEKAEAALELYALAGISRDELARLAPPGEVPLFDPALHGGAAVRFADLGEDARRAGLSAGPGAPPGPGVRSYLAVPVKARSGETLGFLCFGHPEPGAFSERLERLVGAIAAQAGIAIDNARLFEAAQRAAEERRALLDSERSARATAERMSQMKDEFLATLSHELRTPLNAIIGWAHVLRHGARDQADLAKGLDTIERNARVQAQLIEDLLDMSRITSGKMRLDVQPIQPVAFVEAAIETVRPAAEAKGIRLEAVLDPTAGPISGDPSRLQQVAWNLLSNAIKFTPKGGRVQVVLSRAESHAELVVADTGAGIRPELIDQLFERFRQADASTTRGHGGLGLGLSIVKHLVELHGGVVRIGSPGEGAGTTVVVELPLLAAHRRTSGEPVTAGGFDGLTTASTTADLAGLKVLVVDDQREARELILRVLEDCNAQVLTAASAAEALDLVETQRPDVLVSDIGMPEADGFELLRRVRALGAERGGRVPAIALTAFARSEDRTRALRAGFLVHVAKPVDPAELIATVATVTGRAEGSQ
jgi:PAS domain S-box-containing protein